MQCDPDNPQKQYYSQFSSITLNNCESQFSQAKLKLYGLYCALGALQLYLIGVRNLIVEVDTRYIKGMLSNPDIAPSASINQWIISIPTFHFTLVHITGTHHGPDGLSRCPPQDKDDQFDNRNDFRDWINRLHGFVHQINPIMTQPFTSYRVSTLSLSSDLSKGEDLTYDDVPQTNNVKKEDKRLICVRKWLEDLV
ncbi:hypothetical protein L208DRAFT_1299897 [Tricholoma matsutake]|nr:hypothetical protein L208DRAFT_1299897 [Tricholoma matsutake 945]